MDVTSNTEDVVSCAAVDVPVIPANVELMRKYKRNQDPISYDTVEEAKSTIKNVVVGILETKIRNNKHFKKILFLNLPRDFLNQEDFKTIEIEYQRK